MGTWSHGTGPNPFHPLRLGRPAETSRWVRLLDAYAGPAWSVERIALLASHLGEGPRRRPRYELIDELPLG